MAPKMLELASLIDCKKSLPKPKELVAKWQPKWQPYKNFNLEH